LKQKEHRSSGTAQSREVRNGEVAKAIQQTASIIRNAQEKINGEWKEKERLEVDQMEVMQKMEEIKRRVREASQQLGRSMEVERIMIKE
jgi:hypothetical protein